MVRPVACGTTPAQHSATVRRFRPSALRATGDGALTRAADRPRCPITAGLVQTVSRHRGAPWTLWSALHLGEESRTLRPTARPTTWPASQSRGCGVAPPRSTPITTAHRLRGFHCDPLHDHRLPRPGPPGRRCGLLVTQHRAACGTGVCSVRTARGAPGPRGLGGWCDSPNFPSCTQARHFFVSHVSLAPFDLSFAADLT